jgi:hypothetical protein
MSPFIFGTIFLHSPFFIKVKIFREFFSLVIFHTKIPLIFHTKFLVVSCNVGLCEIWSPYMNRRSDTPQSNTDSSSFFSLAITSHLLLEVQYSYSLEFCGFEYQRSLSKLEVGCIPGF